MDRRQFIKLAAGSAALGFASCAQRPDETGGEKTVTGNVPVRNDGDIPVGLLGFGCMRWPVIKNATAKALSRHPRENYLIATKMSVWDCDRQKCIDMYRRSLEIYGTDYIDYYLLHSVRDAASFEKRFVDCSLSGIPVGFRADSDELLRLDALGGGCIS